MEFDKKTVMIGVGILVVIALIYFYFMKSKKNDGPASASSESSSGPTIYGTMTCPYTVKQVEKYPDYKFVDCSGGKCPDFVSAFPTTKHSDGKIEVGFS
jgi:hypothetical protein